MSLPTSAADAFCGACGQGLTDASHEQCPQRLAYDPPRFCTACGKRLDVQVYPAGFAASCRRCGATDLAQSR